MAEITTWAAETLPAFATSHTTFAAIGAFK